MDFGQVKFSYGGLVLGSSHFPLLLQLHPKMTLASIVVKFHSKKNSKNTINKKTTINNMNDTTTTTTTKATTTKPTMV